MPAALRGLLANVAAGARLALLLPVGRAAFRLDAGQLVLVAVLSAAVDAGVDWLRYGPEAVFDVSAVGGEFAALGVLLCAAALLAWLLRDAPLLVALPVVVLASLPLVQLASAVPDLLDADPERPAWTVAAAEAIVLVWLLLVLGRSAYVALAPHRARVLRALVAAVLLAAPLVLPPGLLPDAPWWSVPAGGGLDPADPASEPILSLQRDLQDEALAALDGHVPGEASLYFVAFAPDGDGATWGERVASARRLMDGHWRTEGRSLVYVNDATRLTEAPIASVTHLREALEEIAAAGDPDEDVVMLHLAGRSNADGTMRVRLPPLGLVQLSGPGLASLLKQAGLKWRVIVVATCAPQGFVDALADANTLLIAASGATGQGEGCRRGDEPAAFADAVFGEALATAPTLPAAFAAAHRALAERGAAPVVHVGTAVGAQLARLRGLPAGRAALAGRARG